MSNSNESFFVTGGTLRHDAPSYVERQADKDLYARLIQGEFCYVLTSRQMGKSSLMVRTAQRLRELGNHVVVLDLTAVGQNLTPEQWYDGLILRLGTQLRLDDEVDEFWNRTGRFGPVQRLFTAIREVVLPKRAGQLVIFVDELDTVRSLPFSTDEFFAAIRECYNRRTEDPELPRLTFCLLGVATPSDLIRDTRMTPFNIGGRIELNDFTSAEAASLAKGFGTDPRTADELLNRILYWTNGHPYLTQRLCRAVAEANLSGTNPSSNIRDAKSIDRLCEDLFLSTKAQECDDNLLFVRERMLRSEVDLAGLLTLYEQVRNGRTSVPSDESNPLVSILRLSGIARVENGGLVVRNRIYAKIFDGAWVKTSMPGAELRRQRAAYRRGLVQAAAAATVVFGAIVAFSGMISGFIHYGGKLASLFHSSEILMIIGSLVGGLTISFGPLRPVRMFLDVLGLYANGSRERLQINVRICESASLFSIAGGVAATILGWIMTLNSLNADMSRVREQMAAALTGVLIGILLAGMVFQPVKYHFIYKEAEETAEIKYGAKKWILYLPWVPIGLLILLSFIITLRYFFP